MRPNLIVRVALIFVLMASIAMAADPKEPFRTYTKGRPTTDHVNTTDNFLVLQNDVVKQVPGKNLHPWIQIDSGEISSALAEAKSSGKALFVAGAVTCSAPADFTGVKTVVLKGGSIDHGTNALTGLLDFHAGDNSYALIGTGSVTGMKRATPWWFGASDGLSNDSTTGWQMALDATRDQLGTVFAPNGTYKITSTLRLSDGTLAPPNIKGESARGVILVPTMVGTTPCLQDKRNSMSFPNKAVIENITIQPMTVRTGTAIEVSGGVGEIFRNVYINNANYGIWLHDNSGSGTWTEANVFEDVWIDYANDAIRIEKGTGNGSFHANDFSRVNINIGANQTAVNHVSGFYYNARFQLAVWVSDNSATVVNAGGNAESNLGSITLEILEPSTQAKITGAGRFWFTGSFNYVGGSIVDTAGHGADGSAVFSCSNYRYTASMVSSNLAGFSATIPTYNANKVYNGLDAMGLWKLIKANNYSFMINGFGGGTLYTSNSGYNAPLENASPGLGINLDGSALTTYNAAGMGLLTGPSQYAAYLKGGEFYISSLDRNTKIISGLGNPNGLLSGGPGSIDMVNAGGTGSVWVKTTGTDANGWTKLLTAGDTGVLSFNGSTAANQTFVNGTNIAVTTNTSTGAHTVGITGTIAEANIASASKWNAKQSPATTLSGYGIGDAYTKTQVDSLVSSKQSPATTLSGYGITDAYTKTQVDSSVSAKWSTPSNASTLLKIGENLGAPLWNGSAWPGLALTSTAPNMDGVASAGSGSTAARVDHVHPVDTSRAAVAQTMYIGTTAQAINRTSGAETLTGVSIDGNAATATALATNPTVCPAGQAPLGILANGDVTGCSAPVATVSNADTLNGFSASQTPAAGQIPVLKSSGSLVIPNNFSGAGIQHVFGQTTVYSQKTTITTAQDVLLAYNDYFSGTITVTYQGTGRFSVKSFTITAASNHTPTSADYLKLRQFYTTTSSLGTPYIKFLSANGTTPHLYIPVANPVSDGTLTVTLISDTGHHPWFLPATPAGTLGTATSLTGL